MCKAALLKKRETRVCCQMCQNNFKEPQDIVVVVVVKQTFCAQNCRHCCCQREKKNSLAGSLTCRSGSDLILPLQAPLTRGLDLIVKTSFDA